MLKTLWRGWLVVARAIGSVQSRIIMTVVYFVVIGPFALAVRLFSDPLSLKTAASWHWLPRGGATTPSLESVRQQF